MAAIYWPYVKCDQYFIAIVLQLGWQDSILLQGKVHTYMYIRGVLGHPQEITLGHPAASKMLTAGVPQNYFLRVLLNAPYICVYVIFNLTQNYFLFPISYYFLCVASEYTTTCMAASRFSSDLLEMLNRSILHEQNQRLRPPIEPERQGGMDFP